MRAPGRWISLAVTATLAAAACAVNLVVVRDPDAFHHLALGREIVTHGLRAEEPFLYPFANVTTGPAPYWLGSVLLYLAQLPFGEAGLVLVGGLTAAAIVVVVLLDARPRGSACAWAALAGAAVPAVLLISGMRGRTFARPQLFATLLVASTLWAIRRFEDGKPRLLLAFPLLSLLWTNVHPSVAAGLAAIGLYVAVGVGQLAVARLSGRRLPGTPTWREAGMAGATLALGAAATLATPAPTSQLRSALDFALASTGLDRLGGAPPPAAGGGVLPLFKEMVSELQPLGAEVLKEPLGALFILTALSFVLAWRTVRLRELVTVAAFAFLGFHARRFAVLAAVVAAPVAARNLAPLLAAVPERVRRIPARAMVAAGAVAAAAIAAFALPRAANATAWSGMGISAVDFPARAVDYLAEVRFEGRLFNSFALGGYLEWRVGRAFQDGRGLLRPGDEVAALQGPIDRGSFAALDARYRFDALVLEYPKLAPDAVSLFTAMWPNEDWVADRRTWALVAFDDGGLLYLRRDGRYAALAERDEFRYAIPDRANFVYAPEQLPLVLADYRRSVAAAPGSIHARRLLGEIALLAGQPEEAARAVAPVLAPKAKIPILLVAARAAAQLGNAQEALRHYRHALDRDPRSPRIRGELARLLAGAGQLEEAYATLEPNLSRPKPAPQDLALALDLARRLGRSRDAEALLLRLPPR